MTCAGIHREARLAGTGRELQGEMVRAVPGRTLKCDGREFKHCRSLAKTGSRRSVFCLPLINPVGLVAAIWYWISNITDLTYTAFIVALSVAFNQEGDPDRALWLGIVDMIGSVVYILDMFMGFHVGIIARWDTRAVVVMDGHATASFYVKKSTFFPDLVATVPTFAQVVVWALGLDHHAVRLVYILRLLRLYRVVRLLRALSPGSGGGPLQPLVARMSVRSLVLLNAIIALAVIVNLLGCVWWNIAINEGLENSWANSLSKNYDLLEASNFDRWLVSCYFALTTMVTIGYGDITPVTIQETGFTVLFEIVGVAFFGYILNVITTVLSAMGPRAKRVEAIKQKLQDVEEMMTGMHLPLRLKHKIRGYFATRWTPPESHDLRYQLYMELPANLRARLIRQRQLAVLAELHFLPEGLPHERRSEVEHILAAASLPMSLDLGQELQAATPEVAPWDAHIDLSGPCFYLLEEGEMRALRPGASRRSYHHHLGGRVDFSGPAVVGLLSLFSPAACLDSWRRHRAGVDKEGAGEEGECIFDASSSSSGGSSSSSSSSSDGEGGPEREAWRPQRALALTHCHLWRVDCRLLYEELLLKEPEVLLYLLRQVMATQGLTPPPPAEPSAQRLALPPGAAAEVAAAVAVAKAAADADGGAEGWQAAAPAQQQPSPSQQQQHQHQQPPIQRQSRRQQRQVSFGSVVVERLLQAHSELVQAVAERQAEREREQEAGKAAAAAATGISKLSEAMARFSTHTSWHTDSTFLHPHSELSSVAVTPTVSSGGTRAAGWGMADVWQGSS